MSTQLYYFYGMSAPCVLLAGYDEFASVLGGLSNSFSSYLVNSLQLELELLDYNLYHSGKFKYRPDTDSDEFRKVLTYADFGINFRRYMKKSSEPDFVPPSATVTAIKGTIPLTDLDDLDAPVHKIFVDKSKTNFFSDVDENTLISETNSTIQQNSGTASQALDDLDSPLDMAEIDVSSSLALGGLSEGLHSDSPESVLPGNSDLDDLDAPLESVDLMGNSSILDDVLVGSLKSGDQLLEELSYNADFFNLFTANNYEAVLEYIHDWVPNDICDYEQLVRYIAKSRRGVPPPEENSLQREEEIQNRLNGLFAEREQHLTDEALLDMRIKSNQSQLESLRQKRTDAELFSEFFPPDFAKFVESKLDRVPQVLLTAYYDNNSVLELEPLEHTIISGFHKLASMPIDGVPKLTKIIDLCREVRNKNTASTQMVLNTKYNSLLAKNSTSTLLTWNKQTRQHFRTHEALEPLAIYQSALADCDLLLDTSSEEENPLEGYLKIDYGIVDGVHDIRTIRASDALARATQIVNSGVGKNFEIAGVPADPGALAELLTVCIGHGCLMPLIDNCESLYCLYKIWCLIHKYPASGLIRFAGYNGKVSAEWLRAFSNKFMLTGLYLNPVEMFKRCLRNGIILTDNTALRIEPKRKALYENIFIVRSFVSSKLRDLIDPKPFFNFWG